MDHEHYAGKSELNAQGIPNQLNPSNILNLEKLLRKQ